MNKRLLPCIVVALLAGCSPINADNYAKLRVGMSMAEVEAVLGKPNQCAEIIVVKKCTWGSDSRTISVSFAADVSIATTASGL